MKKYYLYFCLFLLFSVFVRANHLSDSLYFGYEFNDLSNTTAYDVKGYNNASIVGTKTYNMSLDSSLYNYSICMNGNFSMLTQKNIMLSNKGAVSINIYTTKLNNSMILDTTALIGKRFSLQQSTLNYNGLYWRLGANIPFYNVNYTNLWNDTFNNYIFVWNNDIPSQLVYKNGVLIMNASVSENITNLTTTIMFFKNFGTNTLYYNGCFDNIYMFNDTINITEIQMLNTFETATYPFNTSSLFIDKCVYSGFGIWNINISDNCTINSQTINNTINVFGNNGILTINGSVLSKAIYFQPLFFNKNFIVKIMPSKNLGVYK